MNKSKIRKKLIKFRMLKSHKNLEIDFAAILKRLRKKKIYGKVIGGYYPYNYEYDSTKILKKFEKKNFLISLPRIKKNSQMDFLNWSTDDPLEINNYGIPEPTSNKIQFPDILLVPIVAYDKDCNRVGYGGGFYDRYIKKINKIKKIITIGLAYSFQEVKKISINKHDMKLDFIITEKST